MLRRISAIFKYIKLESLPRSHFVPVISLFRVQQVLSHSNSASSLPFFPLVDDYILSKEVAQKSVQRLQVDWGRVAVRTLGARIG